MYARSAPIRSIMEEVTTEPSDASKKKGTTTGKILRQTITELEATLKVK